MATGTVTISANIGSVSRSKTISRTGSVFADDVTPIAGKSGTLTTRTDSDTGVITSNSHGLTTADKVDVGWVDGDSLNQARARMDITSYDTNTITVDGGTGTVLPAQDTSVVVGKRSAALFSANGENVNLVSLHTEPASGQTTSRAMVDFCTSAPVSIKSGGFPLDDGEPFVWADNSPVSNPFGTSDIARIEVSSLCAATSPPTVSIEVVYNADA